MSIAWLKQEKWAFEWDSSHKWLWMYFHNPALRSRLDTMSTVDNFIVLMWPVMISLILSLDTFDCSGESPCTTKVGRIFSRNGTFICDVDSTCVSQRGIQREFQTWRESTNGLRLNKAVVWFCRFPCDWSCHKSTSGQCLEQSCHIICGGVHVNFCCGEIPRWLWGGC